MEYETEIEKYKDKMDGNTCEKKQKGKKKSEQNKDTFQLDSFKQKQKKLKH